MAFAPATAPTSIVHRLIQRFTGGPRPTRELLYEGPSTMGYPVSDFGRLRDMGLINDTRVRHVRIYRVKD